MQKVHWGISRRVDPNIKRSIKMRGLVLFTRNCVLENLNTIRSKLDLISAKLCFDTTFSVKQESFICHLFRMIRDTEVKSKEYFSI